jgi:5-methylcytosine-specific restriction enzyme subunit McrC
VGRAELENLSEGQRLYPVELTQAEAAALNRSGLVTAQPDVDGWRVTAEYAVGAVRRGDRLVRVTPKIGVVQVLTLLARAQGVQGLKVDAELMGVSAATDLSAVLAVLFAQEAATAMAAGPLRGYRSENQTLPVLRGRVRLRDQYLRRFGVPVPFEVTVDEWTLDTDDNRRLRAATAALLTFADVPEVARRGLLRLARLLSEAWLPPRGAALTPWVPTRLNARMHRLLHLADVALAHTSVEHEAGGTQTHGFVINMAWLFETLIARLLSEQTSGLVTQEVVPLDTLRRLSIRPDLVFHNSSGPIAVADTKYKLLDDDGNVPNADVYQLVTYCARLRLNTGHLIYAAGQPSPEPFEVDGTDVRLVVHAIDVTRPLDDIESQVAQLAHVIIPGRCDATPTAPAPRSVTANRAAS